MTNDSKVLTFIRSLDGGYLSPSKILLSISLSVITFLLLMHFTIISINKREFEYYTEDNFSRAERVVFHLTHGLKLAEQSTASICSEPDLVYLRSVLQRYYHIGDLARIKDNKIMCSVKNGLLRSPTETPALELRGDIYSFGSDKSVGIHNHRPLVLLGNTIAYVSDIFLLEFDLGGTRTTGYGTIVHALGSTQEEKQEASPFVFSVFGHILAEDVGNLLNHTNDWRNYLPTPSKILTNRICNEYLSICVTTVNTELGLFRLSFFYFMLTICSGVVMGLLISYIVNMYSYGPIAFRRRLKSAILKGEITPYYQPQVKMKSRHVCGVEALARWHDKKYKKMIPPDVFIPFAESEKLINILTEKFIQSVLKEVRKKLKSESDFTVSINVASSVLTNDKFVIFLDKETKKHDLEPRQIILEITERSSDENEKMAKAANILCSMGYLISLDDFGTGFSNLEWLTTLNPHEIKIDKMFTQSINTDSINAMTLNGMLHMLDHLDVKTVFEGIETEHQLQTLKKRLPDAVAQGWLFAKPVAIDQLDKEITNICN